QEIRQQIATRERDALRLPELKARPLTSFVRNRLINDIYLPIIGDNLAKQMGTVGEGKRSDLMGLLMMISPPGYGKTTLMEYVAHSLGLVFVKINGPALGHEVRSLDPVQAPDSTSRQELEKLGLALEMGNNVMLYVDDIQHTHPEFLQKFISLCDGTRRIEGVWRGRTKTYDLRGKKFCVVMAGNPYTESGEVFRIPDMLANRADIYNLGDVLGGMEDSFTLSYIENSLTSNPVLAPLATRDLADLYVFADRAKGRDVSTNGLSHAYGAAEINEIVGTLQRIMQVRDVVYRVNQQYIASAAQADKYRTEPAFKLQGSYRNMNKLAEKISPVMNDAELQQLVSDHYLGEAQLLTMGAEENLLKLKELRGVLTPEEAARWEQIKRDFLRSKAMGGDDADMGGRVVAQLADIAGGLQALGAAASAPAPEPPPAPVRDDALPDAIRAAVAPLIEAIRASHDAMRTSHAQQSEAADAMLRVISAARAEPTIVREVVHVATAAACDSVQPIAVVHAGESAAAAGQPIGVASVAAAAPVTAAAAPVAVAEAEAGERAGPVAEAEPVATAPIAEEARVEDTLHNLPIIGGDSKPLRVWPPKRGG
ncbi:MAG TPA: ATP-binding protein, partial [Longimicrobium sp.]|nr:ATP-binding protein [Longimicrobium sp.]